jgi:hypothetical protein
MTNDEVRMKFYNLATRVVGQDRAEEIVRFTDSLESQENINSLAALLVV